MTMPELANIINAERMADAERAALIRRCREHRRGQASWKPGRVGRWFAQVRALREHRTLAGIHRTLAGIHR